jgi:hypothetical protein
VKPLTSLIAISLPAILLIAGCGQRGPMMPGEVFETELGPRWSCGSLGEPRVTLQRLHRVVILHPHRGHGRFGRGWPCSSHQVGGTRPELGVLRGNRGWTPWQVWSVVYADQMPRSTLPRAAAALLECRPRALQSMIRGAREPVWL